MNGTRTGRTLVAIPMKDPRHAKTRLAPVLGDAARERLALRLFERTLAFFLDAFPQFDTAAVTASALIAQRTAARGGRVVRENGANGLNAAAAAAVRHAAEDGYARLLLVPADIPVLLRDELEQVLALADRHALAIAEARDGGTNLLVMTPPRDMPFRFGAASASRHEAEARQAGMSVARCYLPFIGHDLDSPDDCLVLSQSLRECLLPAHGEMP